jgi:hypoxanthine-guanine phosphoribosyltransferase
MDLLALDLMIVSIVHGATSFMGELFGTLGVVSAAEYIVSLHITNNERKWNLEAKIFFQVFV